MKSRKSVLKLLAAFLLPLVFLLMGTGVLLSNRQGRTRALAAELEPFAVFTPNGYLTFSSFEEAVEFAPMEMTGVRTVYVLTGEEVLLEEPIVVRDTGVLLTSITRTASGWSQSTPATLKRANGEGALVYVSEGASVTLENITLDGAQLTSDSAAIVDCGTLTIAEKTTVRNNRNALETGDAIHVAEGASLSVTGGRISAANRDAYAVYACGGPDAATVSISGQPVFNSGSIYLEDGVALEITGYENTSLPVSVSNGRPDGPIATRTGSSDVPIEELVSVNDPATEGYRPESEFSARYTRALVSGDVEEFGFGGFGVNIAQANPDKSITFAVTFSDPVAGASLSLGGTSYALSYDEKTGTYIGNAPLPAEGNEITGWSIGVNYGSGEVQRPLARALGFVRVDAVMGTFTAPAGTMYRDKSGELKDFPANNVIPNDLAIDGSGVAEFEIGGHLRSVFIGVRATFPEGADYKGTLYDADNNIENASLYIEAADKFEYALYQKDTGAYVTNRSGTILWLDLSTSTDENDCVVFSNLSVNTVYVVVVRVKATGGGLPSDTVEVGAVRTLTFGEDTLREDFVNQYGKVKYATPRTPDLIVDALNAYDALTEVMKGYPSLLAKLVEIKDVLPEAFIAEWHAQFDNLLNMRIDSKEENYLAALELIREADAAYFGMQEHIRETMNGLITEEEIAEIAEKVWGALAEAHGKVIDQAKVVAGHRLWDARGYALGHFGLEDDKVAGEALQAVWNKYCDLIDEDTVKTLDAIEYLVAQGRAVLLLQAYYELRADKFDGVLNTYLDTAKKHVEDAAEEDKQQAAYEAMLMLYKEYGVSVLRPDFDIEGYGELFARECERIAEVDYSESYTKEELFKLEEEIDMIIAQAMIMRPVQEYYNGLLERREGRLSASDLENYDELRKTLYEAFVNIENAEESERAAAAEAGKLALYKTLAELLLEERYAAYGAVSEGLAALYEEGRERLDDVSFGADIADINAAEAVINNYYESAVQKLALRKYFDDLCAEKRELAPEESCLADLYAAIDGAELSEKEARACEGMVSLYSEYGKNALADIAEKATAKDTAAVTSFVEVAERQIENIRYAGSVAVCEEMIDAAIEGATQKISVQEYFEALETDFAEVAAVREAYLKEGGVIDKAVTTEEKIAAANEAKRDLYEAFTVATLKKHFEETYGADPDETLTALLEEAKNRLAATPAEEGFEAAMDNIYWSAYWKLALQHYFNELIANANYPVVSFVETLESYKNLGLNSIDETDVSRKEGEAYRRMFRLYEIYGRDTISVISRSYNISESELLSRIYSEAVGDVAQEMHFDWDAEDYKAALEVAEHNVDVILENFDAEMRLTAYYETLTLLTDEDHQTALYEKLQELVSAIKEAELGEKLGMVDGAKEELYQEYLVLLDSEREAEFEAAKAEAHALIESAYADYPADKTLKAELDRVRNEYLAALEEITYERYGTGNANVDPTDREYLNSLLAQLKDLCAAADRELAVAVAKDSVNRFCAELFEEPAGYTASYLKDIDQSAVRAALETARLAAIEAVETAEDSYEEGMRQQLIIRTVYAKAVLVAYANLFDVTDLAERNAAIENAETHETKNAAMFEALLEVYKEHTISTLEADPYRYIDNSIYYIRSNVQFEGDYSDVALRACEYAIDARVEFFNEQVRLRDFYEEIVVAQHLTSELYSDFLEFSVALQQAPVGERGAVTLNGMRRFTVRAAEIFARRLDWWLSDTFVADGAYEAAASEIMQTEAEELFNVLLKHEKAMLLIYAAEMRIPADFEDKGTALHAQVKSLLDGMEEAYTNAIENAADIWAADEAVETLLNTWVREFVEIFYNDIIDEAAKDELLASLAGKIRASAAYEAAAKLLALYVETTLDSALEYEDSNALKSFVDARKAELISSIPTDRAQALADAVLTLHEEISRALIALAGERTLERCGYAEKPFEEIAEGDLAMLEATLAAYRALDESVKAYLDEKLAGSYADFDCRLCDERDKAIFEGERAKAIEYIDSLGKDEENELAELRKWWWKEQADVKALEYLPAYEHDAGDYLHKMELALGEICAWAEADVEVAIEQMVYYVALEPLYQETLANEYVRYSDEGKAALAAINASAYGRILGVTLDRTLEVGTAKNEALAELEGLLALIKAEYEAVPVVAIAVGVKADGSGKYPAGSNEIYGIIENENGMLVSAQPSFARGTATAPTGVKKLVQDKVFILTLEISLNAEFNGIYTVKILLTEQLANVVDAKIVTFAEDGTAELLEARVVGNYLVFETTHFSNFYVYGEREVNLWWLIFILTFILLAELVVIVLLASKVYQCAEARKTERAASIAPVALLAIMIPSGAVVVCIVLGVLIAVATVTIAVLLVALYRKSQEKAEPQPITERVEEKPEPAQEPAAEVAEEPAGEVEEKEGGGYEQLMIVGLPEPQEEQPEEEETESYEQLTIFNMPEQEEPKEGAVEEPAEEPEVDPVEVVELLEEQSEEETVEEPIEEEQPVEELVEEPVEETAEELVSNEEVVEEEPVEELVSNEEVAEEEPAETSAPNEETVEEEQPEEPKEEVVPVQGLTEDDSTMSAVEPVEECAEEEPAPVIVTYLAAEEEPAEEPAEEPQETSAELAEVVGEESDEEPAEENEDVVEESPETVVAEESVAESLEEAAEEPVEELVEEVAEEPVEELVEEVAEEPVVEDDVQEESVEDPVEDVVQEEPVEETEQSAEETGTDEIVAAEEPVAEVAKEAVEEVAEVETQAEYVWQPVVVPEDVPEEYRLPEEELRGEVAASEVNALMQDDVAKNLIEISEHVADKKRTAVINVDTLGEFFESGERVTLEELKKRIPYFNKKVTYVKILARGRLNKALVVEGDDFSLEAVKMIAITGGHVIRTRRK